MRYQRERFRAIIGAAPLKQEEDLLETVRNGTVSAPSLARLH